MEITGTGFVLLAYAVVCLLFRDRWLYPTTVFFMPFTATAIANSNSGFWLTPFQLFFLLWMCTEFIRFVSSGRLPLPVSARLPILFMFVFCMVLTVSLMMPLILDGEIIMHSPILNDPSTTILSFESTNITRTIYVYAGAIFAMMLVSKNVGSNQLKKTIQILVLSGLFVSAWGLLEYFIKYWTDWSYPAFIFNNSANEVAQGFRQIMYAQDGTEIRRVSSVMQEPSLMSQYLIVVAALIITAGLKKIRIFSTVKDYAILILVISALLLSTSSSAYIGLAILLVIVLSRSRGKVLWFAASLFGVVIVAANLISPIQQAISDFVLTKFTMGITEGSGAERFMTIKNAYEYFLQSPFLGLGWGSVTSHDLLFNLLANAGVIGLMSFLLLIGSIYIRYIFFVRSLQLDAGSEVSLLSAIHVSFGVLLLLQILTGFTYSSAIFWALLGLCIASYSLAMKGHAQS